MAQEKRSVWLIIAMVCSGCLIMAIVDAVIVPSYTVKSLIKLALFLAFPLAYSLTRHRAPLRSLFRVQSRRNLTEPLFLGLAVYGVIIGGFLLGRQLIDWSAVSSSLQNSQENIFLMGAYISLVNSLLEEFFFRGFAFLMLKEIAGPKLAYLFSAGIFSLYHIAIMHSWFSPLVFALMLVSLFFAGLLFNWLNERYQNLYASWMVHMFANLAINTVGLLLIIDKL
ncbi:CPBP family intramembrane glutamic endopeptidase [Christensenellaceae bacterium 44-20]